jgi:putative ABC transport system permease protein
MLSKDFLKYVLIAAIIAWPLAGSVFINGCRDYAYRINISWWIFLLSVVIALSLPLLTISFQAFKAADNKPC